MNYSFPLTIENGHGEKLIFKEILSEADGDKLIVEGVCQPNHGPAMHVHYKQEECIKVIKGKIGYELENGQTKILEEGESILFPRGTGHRFWNAGTEEATLEGWIKPVNTVIFFLSTLFESQKKGGTGRPTPFDGAYLLRRYNKEYGMIGLPGFVKNFIMPVTYGVGKMIGRYKKFKDAPTPLK